MSDSPDAIRADIEQTRREFSQDVDALADKVNPAKIVERRTEKVKGALGSVKDKILGAADDAGSSAGGAAHDAKDKIGDAKDAVVDAKDRVVAKAEGNPLAVGLIAFGAGLLIASLIPASQREKDLAVNVKDQAQPLVGKVQEAAKEVGENLKEPVQQAAASVKDTAAEAVDHVRSDATSAKDEVVDRAQEARENVSNS